MLLPIDSIDVKVIKLDNFVGGMRRSVDPTKLETNEYPLLVNGRSRYGNIRPIKGPSKESTLPAGFHQGCYGFGQYVFVFIDGKCWIRDYAGMGVAFQEVGGMNMDTVVDRIYLEAVPDSFNNFGRIAVSTDKPADGVDLTLTNTVPKSLEAFIAQDGITRPYILTATGVARQANRFQDWTLANREYVPIGLNTLYHDGILYVVSPDRKRIYHSVTGRPFDFVIAIDDSTGFKLTDNLFVEEADRMAHYVNHSVITSITKLNLSPLSADFGIPMLISTENGTYVVTPDYANMLFGEPIFRNSPGFNTTILNQASITLTRQDFHFVDSTGLRSYTLTIGSEGIVSKEDALSAPIYTLFEGIEQDVTCVDFFDNYTLFGVKTKFGYGCLVYDNLLQRFASLDILGIDRPIKQFCQTTIEGIKKLFFITDEGFYEYYGHINPLECSIYFPELTTDDNEKALKINRIVLSFADIEQDGYVTFTPIVDRKKEPALTDVLQENFDPTIDATELPFGKSDEDTSQNIAFVPQDTKQGFKLGFFVTFSAMCNLQSIQITAKPIEAKVSLKQAAKVYTT